MYIVEVYGANFEPSSPHNLVVYGYIVHMYVYLDRLFSWSSNTLVKLSMPAWPTFMWVMNDSKPIFQSEIKMLSQHGYNMAAWLWKNIRNADRGLIDRGAIHKDVCTFFRFFDLPKPMLVNIKKFDPLTLPYPPFPFPIVVMLLHMLKNLPGLRCRFIGMSPFQSWTYLSFKKTNRLFFSFFFRTIR